MGDIEELAAVLRRQAGVVDREQALAAGMSSSAIGRAVASGRWERVHPRVYDTGAGVVADAAVHAAVRWAGRGAVLRGPSAAWWHGLVPAPPSQVSVAVPRERTPGRRRGVRCLRRSLDRRDVLGLRGLWVTSVPYTILDSAVELGPAVLDRALQTRRTTIDALVRVHHRNLGRRGSPAAGALLAAAADGSRSQAERVAIGLLRAAGVRGWTVNYSVGPYCVDIAFPQRRIAIEIDGWAWHTDPHRFRHDRRRQNDLVLLGWTVLRFTWDDLVNRPHTVVAQIESALRATR